MTETGGEARTWWIWHKSNNNKGETWIRRGDKSPREVGAGGTVGEVNPSSKCAQEVKSGIIQDTNVLVRRGAFLPRGKPEEDNAENSA